jgi:hypothetical protein
MQNEINDKLLREKLGGYNAPFDENAWAQMDAMLDNRKKRRGFFWLWFSGASVAAVMSAVSLMLLSPKQNSFTEIASKSVEVSENSSSKNAALSSIENAENNTQLENENSFVNTPKPSSGSATADRVAETPSVAKSPDGGLKTKTSNNKKSTNSAAKNQYKNLLAKDKTFAKQNASNAFNRAKVVAENTASNNAVREDILFASINSLPAFLLSNEVSANEIYGNEKVEEGSAKLPLKKKLFHYELGAVAGASASFTQGKFHNQANWFAGMQQAFRIGKYVAITNGINYSKTSFALHDVKNSDSLFSPMAYSSNIHSVAIPIGINVYPVSSKRVSWFIGAGVVNHIKVKEDLNFEVPADVAKQMDNLTNSPTTTGNFTEQFWNEKSKTAASNNDYSLGSKRYFANFYSTTGVEIKLLPSLLLNVGATYQLSISKTGNQNARPMFFGGEAGLRYRF